MIAESIAQEQHFYAQWLEVHSAMTHEREQRELWESGVQMRSIRALYPIDLSSYLPAVKSVFLSRARLYALLSQGILMEEHTRNMVPGAAFVAAQQKFVYGKKSEALIELAKKVLKDDDLQRLQEQDGRETARALGHLVSDIMWDFALAMLCLNSWGLYVKALRQTGADSSDVNYGMAEVRINAAAEGLPKYLPYLRTHFARLDA